MKNNSELMKSLRKKEMLFQKICQTFMVSHLTLSFFLEMICYTGFLSFYRLHDIAKFMLLVLFLFIIFFVGLSHKIFKCSWKIWSKCILLPGSTLRTYFESIGNCPAPVRLCWVKSKRLERRRKMIWFDNICQNANPILLWKFRVLVINSTLS